MSNAQAPASVRHIGGRLVAERGIRSGSAGGGTRTYTTYCLTKSLSQKERAGNTFPIWNDLECGGLTPLWMNLDRFRAGRAAGACWTQIDPERRQRSKYNLATHGLVLDTMIPRERLQAASTQEGRTR